jgi:hypothetical protein
MEESKLITDAAAAPWMVEDVDAEWYENVKTMTVTPELLRQAIRSHHPEMVRAVLEVGLVKDVSLPDMCLAFVTEAPDAVLDALDAVFSTSKTCTLMDRLVKSTCTTKKALECYRRAHARYGELPTAKCWRFVNARDDAVYDAWHEELEGKVKPSTLSQTEIHQIVSTLRNGSAWKTRLLDLEKKGFVVNLSYLKRIRWHFRAVDDVKDFVTSRVRSQSGHVQAHSHHS